MKSLALHALVTLAIVALALVAYDRGVRRPAARIGLIDVGEVVRLKDARVIDVLTRAGTSEPERKAAVEFGSRFTNAFPQALDELTQECDCLVLARSAVAGLPPQAVDLTGALKQKVGL